MIDFHEDDAGFVVNGAGMTSADVLVHLAVCQKRPTQSLLARQIVWGRLVAVR